METLVETVCRACEDAVRTGSAVLIDEPRVLTPATLSTLTAFADHRGLRILMHTTAPDELPPHVRAAVKPVALAVSAPALEYWRTFREAPVPPPRAAKPRYTR